MGGGANHGLSEAAFRASCVAFPAPWVSEGLEDPLALAAGLVPEEPTARKAGHLGHVGRRQWPAIVCGVWRVLTPRLVGQGPALGAVLRLVCGRTGRWARAEMGEEGSHGTLGGILVWKKPEIQFKEEGQ